MRPDGGSLSPQRLVPPRGIEPPLHGFSDHRLYRWSTAALVGALGLAPSCPAATALQAASVKLYRQRSRGVIGGTCTRFGEGHGLVPRLLRHRPQSAWSESNTLLSLIGQPHDPRATGGKELVWAVGIAPTTSRTRTARSAPELHPYAPCLMAGIEPAAVTPHGGPTRGQANRTPPTNRTLLARIWSPGPSARGRRKTSVPPEGFEPSPSTFAGLCPVLRTVAFQSGRLESHQRPRACHARALLLSYVR